MALHPAEPGALAERTQRIAGTAVALIRVPTRREGGPPPGRYQVHAHRITPSGARIDLPGAAGILVIAPGEGIGAANPLPLPVTGASAIPLPRVTLSVRSRVPSASPTLRLAPAAAGILLRYPADKLEMRGIVELTDG